MLEIAGDLFEFIGNLVVGFILGASDLLREDHIPGVVSAGLLVILIGISFYFILNSRLRRRTLSRLQEILTAPSDSYEFSVKLAEINLAVKELAAKTRPSSPRNLVATAWDEYSETFIHRKDGDRTYLCNSVRPSQFFNPEDLGFGIGSWRVVPGLFVTVGLGLTFLGLISALHAMDAEGGVSEEAMTELLSIASAKFIMSLTGLVCSIVFTIVSRFGMGRVESATHKLNVLLEGKLSFLSLEGLGVDQIDATREQKEHFRLIGMELVEELGRPLREELPKTISESIGNAVSPLIKQVGELGTSSVGDMVQDLSSRFATDVEGSLQRASVQLEKAGDQFGSMLNRMDGTASRMGSEMEGANQRVIALVEEMQKTLTTSASNTTTAFSEGVESILAAMRTTLEGIRTNTSEGASAMTNAAAEMRRAAEHFRDELSKATEQSVTAASERFNQSTEKTTQNIERVGSEVGVAIEGTGRTIATFAGEVVEKAGRELLEPVTAIASRLDEIVNTLSNGAIEMRRASEGVKEGAAAASVASSNFRGAAQALVAAGDEVKPSVNRLETATHNLVTSTRQIGESSQRNTESVSKVLDAAQIALGSERQGITSTLQGLEHLLEAARGQGDRLDDIDEKLGSAFEKYRTNVEEVVNSTESHVTKMQNELTPALDTLREILDQLEPFQPEQTTNRLSR